MTVKRKKCASSTAGRMGPATAGGRKPAGQAATPGRRPGSMAGVPAAQVRNSWGVSRKTFARMAGFSERALAGWEAGEPVGEPGLRRLRELERLREALARVMRPEFLPQWLDTPNEAFAGLKPLEVVERGEVDRLWGMIFYLESGVPS